MDNFSVIHEKKISFLPNDRTIEIVHHLRKMIDIGEDRILQSDVTGYIVIAEGPVWRRRYTALETSRRQAREHVFGIAANQRRSAVACGEEAVNRLRFRRVQAVNPAFSREKIGDNGYRTRFGRAATACCCLLLKHVLGS